MPSNKRIERWLGRALRPFIAGSLASRRWRASRRTRRFGGQPVAAEFGGGSRLERLAADNAFALRDTAYWLHRRVEHVSYTESREIRRQFSVDFTIHKKLRPFERHLNGKNVYFVPIALLKKWPPLMSFDLRAQDGRPLPLLSSKKNRAVDAEALVALAPQGSLRDCLEPHLRKVATGNSPEAEQALRIIGDQLQTAAPDLSDDEYEHWLRVGRVAASLCRNSLLWARVEAKPGERCVVKCSFELPAQTDLYLRRRALAAFSWGSSRHHLALPNLGERGSYHLELTPPPGLVVRSAILRLSSDPPRDHVPGTRPGRSFFRRRWRDLALICTQPWRALRTKWRKTFRSLKPGDPVPQAKHHERPEPGKPYVWNTGDCAYMYVAESQDQFGLADIQYRVGDRGLITGSFLAAVAISALLTFFAAAAACVADHLGPAVTTLLLVPGLLGFLVVRPGQHPLMRRQIVGVRALILIVGLLPVAAAGALLTFPSGDADGVAGIWTGLAIASWALTGLLGLSWLLPPEEDPDEVEV